MAAKRPEPPPKREIINHQEALELAAFKRKESNLARCYLELRNDITPSLERERDDLRQQLAAAKQREGKLRREIIEVCKFENVACIRAALSAILAETAEGGGDG